METIDWAVLAFTLIFIVVYGTYKTQGSKNAEEYIKGGNSSKWWTVGLSVMATQASAITFLSTTGQGFYDGMGFVQFYFGLPIAMVIICLVFIPIYHRLKVFTAYEYLESRFDLKTRSLAAILFLIQRSLAAGITIYAPAIILSAVLGWDLTMLNILIGIVVIIYTVSGGTKAVSITQKQQMAVIFAGMAIAFYLILDKLPENINFTDALSIAGAGEKMNLLDFSFDLSNRYTVWTGLLGGTFLMLSYFGTDQSQVQRYLSGKNVKEMQMGLLFNGALKIPMQFFILLVGVMVFVFYQFNSAPLHFNPAATDAVKSSIYASEFASLEEQLLANQELQKQAAFNYAQDPTLDTYERDGETLSYITTYETRDKQLRKKGKTIISKAAPEVENNDKDYVFIHFILNNLPNGLIGLLLAVILSAAMSSTASELNALGATTAVDLYKRNYKGEMTDALYVKSTKGFTLMWGILAIIVACTASLFENLIQLVNIIGSIFYGNILGIFLLAFFIKFVKSNAVFIAALITQIIIIIVYGLIHYDIIEFPYLWLNVVGCGLVMGLAMLLQASFGSSNKDYV
ncbi:sodium:solute symporter [Dokdonia donghaensis]|uniref:Sodium:solute symporter n=1 Tax=Dokdonia donghaensis DSW-1 TaxID=1300343 RepID=A0A0A2GU38_9FLAO|nr:sodium:solute symporter [Dokdonia donghaensis]ANH60695.1 Sodium/glucose cotransporter [Dokdonia donghaensis DSW-1]KGO06028.1 sodium:solute symporter [Dokdonia donghaensis DSW-1]